MKIVLSHEREKLSARKLGHPVVEHAEDIPRTDDITVIRWGNRTLNSEREFAHVVNKASAIKKSVNKPLALETMRTAVRTPDVYTTQVPRGVCAVIRPICHTSGVDFEMHDGPYTIPEGHYGKKFIHAEKEYRAWFAGDDVMMARRTSMRGQTDPTNRSGWGYAFFGRTEGRTLREKALAAKRTLGLDFGAADVLWDASAGEYVFLEMNTAPSLDHPEVLEFFRTRL